MKLFPSKLKTQWYGPFVIKETFPHGAIEIYKGYGTTFKVNEHQVKHYSEGMPKEDREGEDVVLEETVVI